MTKIHQAVSIMKEKTLMNRKQNDSQRHYREETVKDIRISKIQSKKRLLIASN